MNLRELTDDQQAILAQVENGDFSLDDVSDHLEMLEEDRNKKIESYLHVINRLYSEEVTVTAEIDRLQTIRQQKEKAVANTKNWLLMSMKDGEKHEFDLFKVSRVKGREVLQVTNGDLVPQAYYTHKPETWSLDKREVLKALKAGKELQGVEITTGKPSLRIK
tara:strand:+ start:688 stop:1176 length:489 start_codon:yes stop_codon:yes gene_type:complete